MLVPQVRARRKAAIPGTPPRGNTIENTRKLRAEQQVGVEEKPSKARRQPVAPRVFVGSSANHKNQYQPSTIKKGKESTGGIK